MVNAVFDGLQLVSDLLHRPPLLGIQDVLAEDLEDFADRRDTHVWFRLRGRGDGYQFLGKPRGGVSQNTISGVEVLADNSLNELSGPGVLCVAAECRRGEAYCLSGISPLAAAGGKRERRQDLGR